MLNHISSIGISSAGYPPHRILGAKTMQQHFTYLKSEYIPTRFMEMKSLYVES